VKLFLSSFFGHGITLRLRQDFFSLDYLDTPSHVGYWRVELMDFGDCGVERRKNASNHVTQPR